MMTTCRVLPWRCSGLPQDGQMRTCIATIPPDRLTDSDSVIRDQLCDSDSVTKMLTSSAPTLPAFSGPLRFASSSQVGVFTFDDTGRTTFVDQSPDQGAAP